MNDMQIEHFRNIVDRYSQYKHHIIEAFNAVMMDSDKKLEDELKDCGISEEDMLALSKSVIVAREVDIKKKNAFADDWGNHQKELHFYPCKDKSERAKAADELQYELLDNNLQRGYGD